MSRVGVDIGGSFTDAVLIGDDGRVHVAKVPSQPAQIEAAFMDGLRSLLGAGRRNAHLTSRKADSPSALCNHDER
jgi:N-methylhydantoinase A